MLKNVYHHGDISILDSDAIQVGGIAGFSRDIFHAYHTGDIEIEGCLSAETGGISGHTEFVQQVDLGTIGRTAFRETYSLRDCYYNGSSKAVGNQTFFYRLAFIHSVHFRTNEQLQRASMLHGFDFNRIWEMQNGLPMLRQSQIEFKESIVLFNHSSTDCFRAGCSAVQMSPENEEAAYADASGQIYARNYSLSLIRETTIRLTTPYGESAEIPVKVFRFPDGLYRLYLKIIYSFMKWGNQ